MTWNSTLILSVLLCIVVPSQAQTDSARYAARYAGYQGTYLINTASFPVNDVTIYWQDSTLAFKAGGSHGSFDHPDGERFHFITDDHEGTVIFRKNDQGEVTGIQIQMDGEIYEGTKKSEGRKKYKGTKKKAA